MWYVGQTLDVLQAGRKLGTFTVTKIGSSSSRPAVNPRPSTSTALAYKTQPVSTTVNADEYATFTVEVTGGKAPYTYRWENSTDGTNFKSIPVEETWADSVAKPNLKVTYDGVGIIKGNYLRCKVTDANGNVFYCEPLKVIRHFDFT